MASKVEIYCILAPSPRSRQHRRRTRITYPARSQEGRGSEVPISPSPARRRTRSGGAAGPASGRILAPSLAWWRGRPAPARRRSPLSGLVARPPQPLPDGPFLSRLLPLFPAWWRALVAQTRVYACVRPRNRVAVFVRG